MKLFLVAAAGLLVAGPAAAQAYDFAFLDANGNGTLGKLEVIGKLPGLAAGFDLADRDGDRSLDREEYREAAARAVDLYRDDERAAYRREVFRALDMDGDRAVSRTEAQWRPDVARTFGEADRNGSGRLDPGEFSVISLHTPGKSSNPAFSFGELDVNNDQQLERTEAAFHEALERAFREADADGNAKISKSEFDTWDR